MKRNILVDIHDPTKTVKIYLNNKLFKTGTYSEFYELYNDYGVTNSWRGCVHNMQMYLGECEVIIQEYKHS